jgi:hypothetical protein
LSAVLIAPVLVIERLNFNKQASVRDKISIWLILITFFLFGSFPIDDGIHFVGFSLLVEF